MTKPLVALDGNGRDNREAVEWLLETSGAGRSGFDIVRSIEVLTEAGFDPSTIEHTHPDSRTGLPAESVVLSIEIQGECLLAQFSDSWIETMVAPKVGDRCLIGNQAQ